jgi:hypothetical protein
MRNELGAEKLKPFTFLESTRDAEQCMENTHVQLLGLTHWYPSLNSTLHSTTDVLGFNFVTTYT